MYFEKETPSKFPISRNYLLFSPEKNGSFPQNNDEFNYNSELRNPCDNLQPFNFSEEKRQNVHLQDFQNDPLNDKQTHQAGHTSILKLDFLDEILKEDIDLQNKKTSHLESLNALKVKGKAFFKEITPPIHKNMVFKKNNAKDTEKCNFLKNFTPIFQKFPQIKLDEKSKNSQKKGSLTPNERKEKIEKYIDKKKRRIWDKKVNYDCRKKFAESRMRLKGRFVRRKPINTIIDEKEKNQGVQENINKSHDGN